MCGIVVLAAADSPVEDWRVDRAMALLAHRGPDGEGRVARRGGRLVMGHRRLAIFEPGAGGHQPMVAPWGDVLAFNGCIYNFRELRRELEAVGHAFATDCDTEVVLAAWREWGEHAFARFNGDWAMVIHDARNDRLVVCRDRLGVRPLYAWSEHGRLILASEVRPLLAAAGARARLDTELAFDFLTLGLSDHEDRTMVDGVVEVPAGGLWLQDADGRITRRRYHHWPAAGSVGAAEVEARLPELLADATSLRLRAHVPVAAQLSGGMDSGSVAWAVGQRGTAEAGPFLGFFSYGYTSDSDGYDETEAARRTRDHVAPDLPFHAVRVDPTPTSADLAAFLAAQELPVSTPSPLAGLRLYRAMRQAGATVGLTGDGSDELWTGYTRRYLPVAWRDAVRSGDAAGAWAVWRSPELRWRDAVARLAWALPRPLLRTMLVRRPHMCALTRQFVGDHARRLDALTERQSLPLDDLGRRDAEGGLLSQILRYADRNAMASGMESRSPFLDYRLAELSMGLAPSAKVGAAGGKLPLRRSMASRLPRSVVAGAKNRGLGHAEQFRVGRLELSGLLADPPSAAKGIIDVPRLARMLRCHPGDSRLWWPVCLLLWMRRVETEWQ